MAGKPEDEKLFNPKNAFIAKFEEEFRKAGLAFGQSPHLHHLLSMLPAFLKILIIEGSEMGMSALNIPRPLIPIAGSLGDTFHEYLVEGLRAFGGGLHQGLQDVKNLTPEEIDAKVKAAAKQVEDEMKKKVRFIGAGVEYVPAGCIHHPRPWAGKGQKASEDIERGQAIEMGALPGCARCYKYLMVDIDRQPKKDDPAKASAPKSKSLVELYHELKQIDEAKALLFWHDYLKSDEITKAKFLKVFGPGKDGTLEMLDIIVSLPHEEWNVALDTMLGAANHSSDKISRMILDRLGRFSDKAEQRLHEEGEEAHRFLDGFKTMMDGICPEYAPEVQSVEEAGATVESQPKRAKKSKTGRVLKYSAIFIGVLTILVWALYAINHTN